MGLDLGGIISDGATGFALGGPIGGLVGAGVGLLGGLFGGGGGGGGAAGPGATMQQAQRMQQQNLEFQQQMDAISQRYSTLSAVERSMHEAIMQMVKGVK